MSDSSMLPAGSAQAVREASAARTFAQGSRERPACSFRLKSMRSTASRPKYSLALVLLAFYWSQAVWAQVTVTHIANEGFLLEGGGKKVLIDAFFDGIQGYPVASRSLKQRMQSASAPFDGVDLVLATHYHDDHFSPGPVLRFLKANPKAAFLSTPQAVTRLRLDGKADPSPRVEAVYPPEGRIESRTINGVRVDVLNLHHGRGRRPLVENLGFVVYLGGRRVLHIGDSEAGTPDWAPLEMHKRPVDLALLPGWYLAEPRWVEVVREQIRPVHIGAMHLAVKDAPAGYFGRQGSWENRVAVMRRNFPAVEVFAQALQRRTY